MVKIKDQIPEGLQETLEKAVAEPKKPKRPKRPRLHQCKWIASSTPEIEEKCKGVRYHEYKERVNLKTIPVLFICGKRKRLTKAEALWYKSMGAEVNYLSETEVKSLNIK